MSIPLRNEVEPFQAGVPLRAKSGTDAELHVYAARNQAQDDLIQVRWRFEGKVLTFTSSRNARIIAFDLREVDACAASRSEECAREARAWVESVLRLGGTDRYGRAYQVGLPWPRTLADGSWFSSAPQLDINEALVWHLRIDAQVRDGILEFLIYKRFPQVQGGFQDGARWFGDEFRARVIAGANPGQAHD